MTDNAKTLVTSALPYVNSTKHLGNLAGSLLPADVHARRLRQEGRRVLFVCGTDEHGTPAEIAAAREGLDVSEFCAREHARHAETYRRFGLSFDHFGRTSSERNRELTQRVFRRLDERGLIREGVVRLAWSDADGRYLPDRYVEGACPHCGGKARGDQCEACTRPLDPGDLLDPRSALSGARDVTVRDVPHLFLRQSALADSLRDWVEARSGDWSPIAAAEARKWLREGVRDRCVTRDLDWGVPVPKPGWDDKVFYVWFDAPIGYVAATADWADLDPSRRDWREWWGANSETRLVQFLGKDNAPFHTVTFPAALIGSGEGWKLADRINALGWLTFDGGKFSTSEGRGVFLDDALDIAPVDAWRWWLAANAPESDDVDFTFERFAADVNHDLADTLGNLAARVLKFAGTKWGWSVPEVDREPDAELDAELDGLLAELVDAHAVGSSRKAAEATRRVWKLANRRFASAQPWATIKSDPERAARQIREALDLVRLSAAVAWPFVPELSERLLRCLGEADVPPPLPDRAVEVVGAVPAGRQLAHPGLPFGKLGPEWAETQKRRFGSR